MFRRARLRLALHYAAGLCVAAALTVGLLYLVLASALDVETTTTRTTGRETGDPGDGPVEQHEDEDVTVEIVEEAESRVAGRSLDRLRTASLGALGALFAGSLAAGWLIAGRVLAPIEQAVAAQQRFIRDTSHELRNPLALMRTSLDLALEDPSTPEATWREMSHGLRSSVDRMAGVVDSLLRAARDEAPDPEGPAGPVTSAVGTGARAVDPRAVLRDVATQVETAAQARDLAVVVDAEPAALSGDPAALTRVVANLVDNAVRHAPAGSTVTLRGGPPATGGYEIRVEDLGPGIPPDEVEAVFERGHRSPDSPGLGLGLAIAREVVAAHGGQLDIEQTGPSGTVFLITLPDGAATPD